MIAYVSTLLVILEIEHERNALHFYESRSILHLLLNKRPTSRPPLFLSAGALLYVLPNRRHQTTTNTDDRNNENNDRTVIVGSDQAHTKHVLQ